MSDRQFTNQTKIINFTKQINPKFKNKYSAYYYKKERISTYVEPQVKIDNSIYQQLISEPELIKQVSILFTKYRHDWTIKDLKSMRLYMTDSFYSIQKDNLNQNIGQEFDIIYNSNLHDIIPIEINFADNRYFFRLQINSSMINFKLSEKGYILAGTPQRYLLSEYWDIEVRQENNWNIRFPSTQQCYLANIESII